MDPSILRPATEWERNPTHTPSPRRWQEKMGEGENLAEERWQGRQGVQPAGDRWSVNKPGGPTLPQPGACSHTRTGKAQDESTAVADRGPFPVLASSSLRHRPGGRGRAAQDTRAPPGARGPAGRHGGSQGPTARRPPGPDYLAVAAPPPAPAPPPSPMLGVRRQRRLPEQPAATSRAGPLSASLRAASALPPQSGHGLRGPRTAPDCRRPGQRGREQARRRGGPEGEGEQRKGASSGAAGS